ncbi:MAG TPA: lipid IV(A) 3-deoxy-D-manno-octulosonic acid transferase [Steroidobacteraceae bacterium]|jgi:3-deoxy-D-manno-octulosonic-acid transferase|nr:lipid IV(A) 3-deoxy-D-manno-octulosonic acid transferase [Steroidobacteraceae bacterium]
MRLSVRWIYTLLLYLALPWASLIVLIRGIRQRDYWRGWGERFGFVGAAPADVWVHAVSVGEVQAALILIDALRVESPSTSAVLTCATPTGRARARQQLADTPVTYAPYDLPQALNRFLRRVRPRLLIVIETELWPNMLNRALRAGVPVLIASARVSQRTADFYRRFPGLLRPALQTNTWIAAQSESDADRFFRLGVPRERIQVAGNIKFDRSIAEDVVCRGALWRSGQAADRPVWIAGSTHPGEESIVLAAQRLVCVAIPTALLILVPRHPARFDGVARDIAATGLTCARRSLGEAVTGASVLLLDTLGELVEFYAAADVAFVGGSLTEVGGHNLIEPAAVGIPVLSGPHQFNSPQVARALSDQGGLDLVHDATELANAVVRLLSDPEARAAQVAAAGRVITASRGALSRVLALAATLIEGQ